MKTECSLIRFPPPPSRNYAPSSSVIEIWRSIGLANNGVLKANRQEYFDDDTFPLRWASNGDQATKCTALVLEHHTCTALVLEHHTCKQVQNEALRCNRPLAGINRWISKVSTLLHTPALTL